jgi:membrane protease subunit HflK
MTTLSKRPEQLAWVSLISSLLFFGVVFLLGRWSGFVAVSIVSWQILAAALVWFVLAVQFHQRSLAEQEKLDMRQLAEERSSATIFQGKGERASLLAAAQRRLDLLEKWFVPIFAVLIAVYEVAIGVTVLRQLASALPADTQQPLICAIVATAVAFVSFLLSRYATGMSAEEAWQPLRAGGSMMLGVALMCFALALCLAAIHFQYQIPIQIIAYVVPVVLIVLGVETALNAVLDIYRPRLKGQYSRAAFDSRLLGTISEPGGIFHSAASAIDYQFGFQVSQTWFYKLLEKAIVPLILFSAATLYLASCIVVVAPDEQAIVEHFGNPILADGGTRTLNPGLHFKWPWPIDMAYKQSTRQVHELHIGYVPKTDPNGRVIPESSLLWGQTHYKEEYSVLVASEYSGDQSGEGAMPVSLIKANIPVQYRIKDLYAFSYKHSNPVQFLEAICYRELTRFAASAKVEVEETSLGADEGLLGGGRTRAKQILTRRIQQAADAEDLGVEVVFLGVQGVHPPPEVAPDFEAVSGAVQKKQALVLDAEAERNKSLSALVGSVRRANDLFDLAVRYQQAEKEGRTEDVDTIGKQFDAAFAQAKGDIAQILSEAESYAFEKATLAKATGERFAGQLTAYRAAPEIYAHEQWMLTLEGALKNIRKYVVAADSNDTQVVVIDLQDKVTPNLFGDFGGTQETSGQ